MSSSWYFLLFFYVICDLGPDCGFCPLLPGFVPSIMATCVVSVGSCLIRHKMFIACAGHACLSLCDSSVYLHSSRLLALFMCRSLDSLKSRISTSPMLDTLYPPLSFLGLSCVDSRSCFCTDFDLGLYPLFGCSSPLQLRRRLTEVYALHFMTILPLTCCSVSLRCGSFSGLCRLDPQCPFHCPCQAAT